MAIRRSGRPDRRSKAEGRRASRSIGTPDPSALAHDRKSLHRARLRPGELSPQQPQGLAAAAVPRPEARCPMPVHHGRCHPDRRSCCDSSNRALASLRLPPRTRSVPPQRRQLKDEVAASGLPSGLSARTGRCQSTLRRSWIRVLGGLASPARRSYPCREIHRKPRRLCAHPALAPP